MINYCCYGMYSDVGHSADCKAAQPPAPTAQPMQQPTNAIDDPVTVPRGLLGAACSAISGKRDAPKTLEQLRRHTVGDLSQPMQQPGAEPVGKRMTEGEYLRLNDGRTGPYVWWGNVPPGAMLYTQAAPAQRQPLSDAQIDHLWDTRVGDPTPAKPLTGNDVYNFARAIEAAHGIASPNTGEAK